MASPADRPSPAPTSSVGRPSRPTPTPPAASMRDRLGQMAHTKAARPRVIRVLYAGIAVFALVYVVGMVAGWWTSPVADKLRRDVERRTAPEAPATPDQGTTR